jgi:HK97 family phage major capsid protein
MSKETLINAALEARAKDWEKAKGFLDRAEAEARGLSVEEKTAFDQINASIAEQDVNIQALIAEDKRERAADEARSKYSQLFNPGARQDASKAVLRPEQRMADWSRSKGLVPAEHENLSFGKYVRGMVTGEWRDAEAERRALAEGSVSSGGAFVPTLLSSHLIDKTRNKSAALAAGATFVPMGSKVVTVPAWTADSSPSWRAEAATVGTSDPTIGQVTLSAKSLAVLVQVSRELIEDGDPNALTNALEENFAAQFALAVDFAALYGTGASNSPLGIKNWTTPAAVTKSNLATNGATVSTAGGYDVLVNGVGALRSVNEYPNAIIYSERTAQEYGVLKDGQGRYLAKPDYLADINVISSNQVPNNLTVGTGTTCSDIIIGDFSQLLIGVRGALQIEMLHEKYADTLQVGFLAHLRTDVAVARPSAFNVLSGVL